ncbi:MAG: ATP-grasp domain-containing protein [Promethearchaeota archaeon]
MRIGIILNRVNFEEKRIIKELESRGHEIKTINNQKLSLKISPDNSEFCGKYGSFDLILQRSMSLFRGLYTSAILESKGLEVINNYESIRISGDKLLTSIKLSEAGIRTPASMVAFTKDSALESMNEINDYPLIIKPIIGSWGRLIAKLENENMARAVLEDREIMGHILQKIYYFQEYIRPQRKNKEDPTDIRVIYLNGECIAAMGRISKEEEFRSNIALGGRGIKLEIDEEMEKICKKVGEVIGGKFLGIDLMKDEKGYVCIEVNGTPQFRGITNATGIDVAKALVDFIEGYKK